MSPIKKNMVDGIPELIDDIEGFILSDEKNNDKNYDKNVLKLKSVLENLFTVHSKEMQSITNAFRCANVACRTYYKIGYVFENQFLIYYKSDNYSVYAVVLVGGIPLVCHQVINAWHLK